MLLPRLVRRTGPSKLPKGRLRAHHMSEIGHIVTCVTLRESLLGHGPLELPISRVESWQSYSLCGPSAIRSGQ